MRSLMLAAAALSLLAGAATAQTSSTTTTKQGGKVVGQTTTKGPAPKAARSEASLACSASADSKNVHGKDRTKFMRQCKKAGGKAG